MRMGERTGDSVTSPRAHSLRTWFLNRGFVLRNADDGVPTNSNCFIANVAIEDLMGPNAQNAILHLHS